MVYLCQHIVIDAHTVAKKQKWSKKSPSLLSQWRGRFGRDREDVQLRELLRDDLVRERGRVHRERAGPPSGPVGALQPLRGAVQHARRSRHLGQRPRLRAPRRRAAERARGHGLSEPDGLAEGLTKGLARGLAEGLVVAAHGRHFLVESADGQRRICHPRGKKSESVVGDRVLWQAAGDEGAIERTLPRRSLLYRQDRLRTKSFAANLDQVLILLGADPPHSEHQLARALIAAEAAGIAPLIALNKSDLAAPFARGWQRLAPYRRMGYPVLALALKPKTADASTTLATDTLAAAEAQAELRERLAGRTTLLLGPSGAGKSPLINTLVPGAAALTGEISRALAAGRHTTTSTRWYWVDAARTTALIDSPG